MRTEEKKQSKGIGQYIRRRAFRLDLISFAAAAGLSRVCFRDGVSPFGAAYLAAVAISGGNAHLVFVGVLLGTLLLQRPMHFAAAAGSALFYIAHLLWKRFSHGGAKIDQLILLFLSLAAMLPVFYAESVQALLKGLVGLGISVFSAFAMQSAMVTIRTIGNRHVLSDAEQVSISLFFGILLLAMSEVNYVGFSLPVVLLLVFSMIAALARGIGGVAVAVAIGAVLTVGGDFTLMFVGSLAACTLAGAALRKANTFGVFAGFLVACLVVGSYVFTASHTINLLNLAVAGVIFLVIPRSVMMSICGYLDAGKNRERYSRKSMRRLRERTADEMQQTAKVCREVAQLFAEKAPETEPPDARMQWITQAAASVCADCTMQKVCWQDYASASASIVEMLEAHERGERIRIRKPFDPSCKHMQQIAAAAWQAQNQYLVQYAMQQQSRKQYAFVNRQLSGVCSVLEMLGKRVREDRWLDEDMEQRILNGLDRRGIRVYGVDASFPHGRLQLHIRVSDTYGKQPLPVCEAIRLTLHRQVRLLDTQFDGRQCTLILEEAQLLTAEMGTANAAISENGVSGDCAGEKRLEGGRVLYALSDGMGAGEKARTESEAALRLLFDLYGTGFHRDVALESVNRLLLESQREMYATLDAVFLDLRTGQAEFIKYGAPPTFVYRGSKLHTVCAEALPAGIVDEATPAIQTAKLRRDDTVFLFSDGALDALGAETQGAITEALLQTRDCKRLSEMLLRRAKSCGQEDDMTVVVIRIA